MFYLIASIFLLLLFILFEGCFVACGISEYDKAFSFQVHKQGSALGRSIDLTKFTCYDELIAELDQMFDFDGELKSPCKNWLVVYTDNEGDIMLVGDDPWK